MPGIFGAVGSPPELRAALKRQFSLPWSTCESVEQDESVLGGHAFPPKSALHFADNRVKLAVDGEFPIYENARSHVTSGKDPIFHMSPGEIILTQACKGNVAVADPDAQRWYLATEWSGTFPLYYFHDQRGFLFCSRLRPLAQILDAPIDPIGVSQLFVKGYSFAGRTLFKGIRRLLPGQVLAYQCDKDCFNIQETSRLWIDEETYGSDKLDTLAELSWEMLKGAVQARCDSLGKHALMMSAGWDSRLLLCAMLEVLGASGVSVYTHGDPDSFELRIARTVCESSGVSGQEEPLRDVMFDPDRLKVGFDRTETIVFPEWLHAGTIMRDAGLRSVSCGTYAAVLGGHNGPTAAAKGAKRVLIGARSLLAHSTGIKFGTTENAPELQLSVNRPSYVTRGFWDSLPDVTEEIRGDFEQDVERLKRRGVINGERLIEAFISEHRGTQYMEAQPLACRANLDVNIPYIDRDLLQVASQIPLRIKFHNAVHRTILRKHAPALLKFPCAATVVPAYMPISLQEAARVVRRIVERNTWRMYFSTRGYINPPRYGWPNYEFLRSGQTLRELVDDLRCDIWNKKKLADWLTDVAKFSDRRQMMFVWQPLLKIYYTDLMLRD